MAARTARTRWLAPVFGLALAAVLLALAEWVLALVGFEPWSVRRDPFVGFSEQTRLFERAGDGFVETADAKLRFFNFQRFAVPKPAGRKRAFCMGGSTTYGHPYDDATSFCGWLRVLLEHADPDTHWDVINAGGISYASYRVVVLMRELARYEPDLFLIYSGHNEFLEERTYRDERGRPQWVRALAERAGRSRVFSLVPAALESGAARGAQLGLEVDAILDGSVGPSAYERDLALRARVIEHYRYNLGRMAEIARGAGARIAFVVPASNEADSSPFRAVVDAGLSAAQRRRVEGALVRAGQRADAGDHAGAERDLREALALDPSHAGALYALGRSLRALGRVGEARAAFGRARDEDVCPLRALGEIQRAVAEVGRELGVPVVDYDAALRELARERGDGLLGDALFLDHVHPTIEANRLLAERLLELLGREGIARPRSDWREAALPRAIRQVEAGIDQAAHGRSLRNVAKVLSWAGKVDDAAGIARRADALLGGDAESRFIQGTADLEHGRDARAGEHFRASLALDPDYAKAHNNLALVLGRQGDLAGALAHYDAALALAPTHATAHYNRANLLVRQGKPDAAIASFRRALELDPGDEDARFNLARALLRSGDPSGAAQEFRTLIAEEPGDPEIREGLEEAEAAIAAR